MLLRNRTFVNAVFTKSKLVVHSPLRLAISTDSLESIYAICFLSLIYAVHLRTYSIKISDLSYLLKKTVIFLVLVSAWPRDREVSLIELTAVFRKAKDRKVMEGIGLNQTELVVNP